QTWISNGRTNTGSFMLALHGGALLLAVLWLLRRHLGFSLRPLLRRLTQRMTARRAQEPA
ncbi:MAG: LPS export ABC transporter permease LptF, partial [Betaproteobacteria bacterium]|nr:LPS export ABC transporter permease LptF [Betaproteobacteria bacterium]